MNVRKAHAKATKQVEKRLAGTPTRDVIRDAWELAAQLAKKEGLGNLFTSTVSGKGHAILVATIIHMSKGK